MNDFARQTHPQRELLIVHDGDAAWDQQCRALAQAEQARCGQPITVHPITTPLPLGELRNRAVALARGPWVCQWDDDDRYHPQRLALQLAAAQRVAADVVFLTSQMHWFIDGGELVLEDWSREPYPANVVQGSLLARKAVLPLYPALRRGEDTALLAALVAQQVPIARLSGMPWLYAYQYHGHNTWDAAHHRAGALAKAFSPAAVRNVEAALQTHWNAYSPPLPPVGQLVNASVPLQLGIPAPGPA